MLTAEEVKDIAQRWAEYPILQELAASHEELRADLAAKDEALRPFASAGSAVHPRRLDGEIVWQGWRGDDHFTITCGDLRRAAEALGGE
jgi:hypothetical protein